MAKESRQKRPNFLLIMTDQHRADHLGCYGNKIVQTPHLDALAERSTRFEKCYVSSGVCMPNRATLMTGRTPTVNGVQTNGLSLPLDSNTFVHVLRDNGYKTALYGKSHLQNMVNIPVEASNYPKIPNGDQASNAFFDAYRSDRSGPRYRNERRDLWQKGIRRAVDSPYYGFDDVKLVLGHDETSVGHYYSWLKDHHENPDELLGPKNALPAKGFDAPQVWRTKVPEELYTTAYIEQQTKERLEAHAKSDGAEPFFIQCSFPDPHHPFSPPGKYFDMYDPADCAPPSSFNAEIRNAPPLRARLMDEFHSSSRDLRVAAFACSESEVREYLALTYGMVSMVDDAVGRIMRKLSDLGLAEDTVVVFTSDHGDLMGDHGLMFKHCFHDEGITRVPLIWADPEKPEARTSDTLTGTIDISSMVLGRAGLAPYYGMQGHDVLAALADGKDVPRAGMLIEEDELPLNANCEIYLRTRSLVTGRWRMTYWLEHGFGELYDRQNDPDEINNLWDVQSAQGDKSELLERMLVEKFKLDENAPMAPFCA